MAYVQLAKALYDYEAQAEDELNLKEDDTLYILEADDAEWYKAKLRKLNADGTPNPDAEDEIGLVPSNYVEEAEPLRLSRALYDYEAQNDDELTISEDELLRVYESDGLWLLVKKQGDDPLGEGGVGRVGYVPANYVDEAAAVDTEEAPEVEDAPAEAYASPPPSRAAIPTITHTAPAVDKSDGIKMWAVSVLDAKKKKKKGTLGIGNGSLFFASESDKTPVQKISVLDVASHALENKGKQIHIDLEESAGIEGNAMDFVCDKKESDEIVVKLDESKTKAERMAQQRSEETSVEPASAAPPSPSANVARPPLETATALPVPPAPPAPPAAAASPSVQPPPSRSTAVLPPPVRKTATSPAPPQEAPAEPQSASSAAADGEAATALYDFEAQGDDELTVAENETLVLVERENDDWWKVRNAAGQEGVVPASYVEVTAGASLSASGGNAATDASGAADDADDEAERQRLAEEEAATAAAAQREREAAQAQKLKEARERVMRDAEERRRREALKAQPAPAPPKSGPSTTSNDNARAAREVKIPEGRTAPARPKEASSKSKPAPGRTRVWHDRTGQFRVEAEFLGFNQGKLRLHKINGVVIEVAIEKMSKPDIQYLEEVTGKRLMPRREGPSSSTAPGAPSADPRQAERHRDRQKEKEREARRRAEANRGPRRNIDWFEFFLAAGVDVHDCTRYAAAFERDNIDDTILPDMEPSVLRSLGLREGDNIRVMKHIEKKYKKSTSSTSKTTSAADIDKQMKADEELARKLQEQERSARRDADGSTSSGLFSGPDGSLKNNTRRGRPTPSSKTSEGAVDAASIARASESLARVSTPPSRSSTTSPAVERKDQKPAKSGFDDDAWTPRPSSTKPSTPVPPVKPATPQAATPAAPTPPPAPAAPPAPVQPVSTPEPPKTAADPNSALFEKLAAMKAPSASEQPQRPGASPSNSSMFGSNGYNPNGPRGPMAPVPQNQGLLQPLVPTQGTGQYVPTRGIGAQQTGWGGMQAQQTGYGGVNGMMSSQPTGFYGGGGGYQQAQQTGYGGMGMGAMASQPTGWLAPQQTAMSPNSSGFASPQPPSQGLTPQQTATTQGQNGNAANGSQQNGNSGTADKYGAGSIFASMKSGTFAKGDEAPQAAQKYDALRPQPTGWSPAGVQQPQQTGAAQWGVNPQMTGMPGMGGMGMMQPQFTAQPGMFPQQGQQQGYGQGYQGGYGQQGGYGYQQY